ncbi:hypothetical protein [Nocardia sp. NPDC051981]|uniref:hypothetical protein n=1 Tax=Nocardia sp. NPDC051981 TaxID=3155417 RepID=UPI0034343D07
MAESNSPRRHRYWGPIQFGERLGLSVALFDRAVADGIIPAPDAGTTSRPTRWSDAVVADAEFRIDQIREAVGPIPDLGAVRAAEVLSQRFGREVTGDTIEELARSGSLPEVGDYKGFPLYCGRTLERFDDAAALEAAAVRGRLYTLDEAAEYLRVRASDLRHLVTAAWLEPVKHGRSSWQRRSQAPNVALYRAADLDALAAHPDIDWDAVRVTAAGRPSPLARLTRAQRRQVQRER